ncbi:SUKH-4 family immunity protein [Streptomyces radicis]|uniref:Uncharacterized protein n=1 Tax=Streptomyces radicis TaxID=1750517 RepID=A0A3A9WI52_9ACTN|nr:SUKH-4 family immunity protein [Streptomyces radicis]RKN12459.1 hypothetical protein D7319_00365 [Streptomyces radicis]RKN27773.1 hypothetical protein D7318_02525 [Streptomyces radicis]
MPPGGARRSPGRTRGRIAHAETRRFLSEAGLPVVPGFLYDPEDALPSGLPDSIGPWALLGHCYGDELCLDGATGALWARPVDEPGFTPANSGVDRFARFLAAL